MAEAEILGSTETDAHVLTFRGMIKAKRSAYTILLEAADNLSDIVPDGKTRLQVAARMRGIDIGQIASAIDMHAEDLLHRHRVLIANQPKSLIQQRIENFECELVSIEDEYRRISEQISSLESQIEDLRKKRDTLGKVGEKICDRIDESKREAQTPLDRALEIVMAELAEQRMAICV